MPKRILRFSYLGLVVILVGILIIVPFVKQSLPGGFREGFAEEKKCKYSSDCGDGGQPPRTVTCEGADPLKNKKGVCKPIAAAGKNLRRQGEKCESDIDCEQNLGCVRDEEEVWVETKRILRDQWGNPRGYDKDLVTKYLNGICIPRKKGQSLSFAEARKKYGSETASAGVGNLPPGARVGGPATGGARR